MLRIHNDATQDLREIRAKDPEAFGKLFALIEQLRVDPQLADKLLDNGFGRDRTGAISVMKWVGVNRAERLPLWRLKFWDLERQGLRYRILYVYYWPERSFNILAIVERGALNYDCPDDPIRRRVTQRCREEFPNA